MTGGWVLMICGILAGCFILLVATVVSFVWTRRRSQIMPNFDEVVDLREKVALLREEVEQLREEVEQARKGRSLVSSPHIKEG